MPENGDMRPVTVRFTEVSFANLWARAKAQAVPVAEVVRGIVEEHLQTDAGTQAAPALMKLLSQNLDPVRDELRRVRIAAEAATWAASFAAVAVGGERTASFTEGRFVQAAREEAIVAIARMDAVGEPLDLGEEVEGGNE